MENRSGKETSEYEMAKSANLWAAIGIVLGVIVASGPALIEQLDGNAAVIVGGIITVASIAYRALVQAGYVRGRTEVKIAAEEAKGQLQTAYINNTIGGSGAKAGDSFKPAEKAEPPQAVIGGEYKPD